MIGNNALGDDKKLLIVEVIERHTARLSQWDAQKFSDLLRTWEAFREHNGDQARLPPHTIIEEFIASRRTG